MIVHIAVKKNIFTSSAIAPFNFLKNRSTHRRIPSSNITYLIHLPCLVYMRWKNMTNEGFVHYKLQLIMLKNKLVQKMVNLKIFKKILDYLNALRMWNVISILANKDVTACMGTRIISVFSGVHFFFAGNYSNGKAPFFVL